MQSKCPVWGHSATSTDVRYKMTVAALTVVALGALVMMVSGIATALAQDTVRGRLQHQAITVDTYANACSACRLEGFAAGL
jgi:hypothetical protein